MDEMNNAMEQTVETVKEVTNKPGMTATEKIIIGGITGGCILIGWVTAKPVGKIASKVVTGVKGIFKKKDASEPKFEVVE